MAGLEHVDLIHFTNMERINFPSNCFQWKNHLRESMLTKCPFKTHRVNAFLYLTDKKQLPHSKEIKQINIRNLSFFNEFKLLEHKSNEDLIRIKKTVVDSQLHQLAQ